MSSHHVLTALFLSTFLISFPCQAEAKQGTFFPDLQAAKEAYKQEDYETAAKNWEPLAYTGYERAQLELGKLYSRGLGVEEDHEKALNLFSAAARQGNVRAMYEIGRAFEKGNGVAQDYYQARRWYLMAADGGYSRAHFALAKLYEANKLITATTQQENTAAQINRALENMEQGNFKDARHLAYLYEQGLDVPKNLKRALLFYKIAEGNEKDERSNTTKILETKVTLDELYEINDQADLILAYQGEGMEEQRAELIQSLKKAENTFLTPAVLKIQKANAIKHYRRAYQNGYERASEKLMDIKGADAPILPLPSTQKVTPPKRKNYRFITDLKIQMVGEENLDLATRNTESETAFVLNGKLGAYFYPTENITTYLELRGLYSEGQASSNDPDEDDVRDLSFIEVRQAWIELEQILGQHGLALKTGRQRLYEPRGLWWNRDLDALKISKNSTLTNGFFGFGQNLGRYRFGNENDLDKDEEDRLRFFGELTHEYAKNQFVELRGMYEYDHSDTEDIGDFIKDDDRDEEDHKLLWAGFRLKGKTSAGFLSRIGYRADMIGVAGSEETINSAPAGGNNRVVTAKNDRDVLGWAFDGSFDFQFDTAFKPIFTIGYAYGSGDDGTGTNNAFRQTGLEGNTSMFPEERVSSALRNYGEVLRPELSNIHIMTLGLSLPVLTASDMNLNYYSYWLDDVASGLRSSGISSRLNGNDTHLGQGLDWMLNWNIGKELETQSPLFKNTALRIRLGGFRAGDAYGVAEGEYAFRGMTELRFRF